MFYIAYSRNIYGRYESDPSGLDAVEHVLSVLEEPVHGPEGPVGEAEGQLETEQRAPHTFSCIN